MAIPAKYWRHSYHLTRYLICFIAYLIISPRRLVSKQRSRLVFRSYSVWISAGTVSILIEVSHVAAQSLQAYAGIVQRSGYGRFIQNHFKFIIHQTFHRQALYRISQEERSVFWEVIGSVNLSKKLCMYMCPIRNDFRDRAISLYRTLYTVQTSNTPYPHTSCKLHWCSRSNFRKCIILGKLYQLCHMNNKYRY
jgi:hypothetical protein